jgi:hypothetical protein
LRFVDSYDLKTSTPKIDPIPVSARNQRREAGIRELEGMLSIETPALRRPVSVRLQQCQPVTFQKGTSKLLPTSQFARYSMLLRQRFTRAAVHDQN